ncbi:hypothetical protein PCANC_07791 [Puccinia coronata f. sp. avenae]|uniref:Uncharacterized protein n=1 Tax=Puccinia coronata f. sp. avenae TaxID=200324 RepID=A0A2N5RV33_9BASI|nr:hypothetical protein PCASD_26443 [Puccinia coronata f. sp. avenae]PLW49377.1 hypothetical protein PCANC_07791 [Puccinia coronata f. sp. avenae]
MVTVPSPIMTECQDILILEQPQVLRTQYVYHILNSIASNCLTHPTVAPIIEGNKLLVDYFSLNSFWNQQLETWHKVHDISPGILVTRFDNNHLSSHSVDVNFTNEGFKYCLEIASDPSFNSPQLPDYIVKLIQSAAPIDPSHLALKEHCIKTLNQHSALFQNDIYSISFFLNPFYRHVLERSLEDITKSILRVAKNWKLTRSEAISIREQLARYHGNLPPFTHQPQAQHQLRDTDALCYWTSLLNSPQTTTLKQFAIKVLEIVPCVSGINELFSVVTQTEHDRLPQDLQPVQLDPTPGSDPSILSSENYLDRMFDSTLWHEIATNSAAGLSVTEVDESWELDDIMPLCSTK